MNIATSQTLPFKKLGDLIYQEGPILSLFVDYDTNMFLCRWVDCDDNTNHWMVSAISSYELSQFYHKKISLRQYYEGCNELVIIEIDNSLSIEKIYALDIVVDDYLPKKNSLYVDNLYTEFSNSLKAMYVNQLAVISRQKAKLYKILGLSIEVIKDNKIRSSEGIVNLANIPNEILPKSSEIKEILSLFRALNHNLRNKILELVYEEKDITIHEIYTRLTIEHSLASQHLAILRKSNLIKSQRRGSLVLYTINHKKLKEIQAVIDTLIGEKLTIHH